MFVKRHRGAVNCAVALLQAYVEAQHACQAHVHKGERMVALQLCHSCMPCLAGAGDIGGVLRARGACVCGGPGDAPGAHGYCCGGCGSLSSQRNHPH